MNDPDSVTTNELKAMGVLGARIPPVPISLWYRLELALGASIAGFFPLVYRAMIALAAWARTGTVHHSTAEDHHRYVARHDPVIRA